MNNYNNAFTEVYTILDYLDEEELKKIPSEVLEVIASNRNLEYEYQIDEDVELKECQMLPETKAILFNLFRDYLSTPEQKEKIIRVQAEERKRNELKKQEKYNTDVFANRRQEIEKNAEETVQLIEYKESIFKRILDKIKSFFKRNKN